MPWGGSKDNSKKKDQSRINRRADIQKENGSQTLLVLLDSLTFTLSQEARLWGISRSKICSCIHIFDKLLFHIWFTVCWEILSLVPPNEGPWQAGSRERI